MTYPSVSLTMNVIDVDRKKGLKDTLRQLEEATVEYGYATYTALFKIAQDVRDTARLIAPKDTGALWKSIYVTMPPTQKQMGGIHGDNIKSTKQSLRASRGYLSASEAAARAGGKKRKLNLNDLNQTRSTNRRNYKRREITGVDREGTESSLTLPVTGSKTSFSQIGEFLPNAYYVSVGASVHYAIYVEFGTHNTKAQPFLRPALKGITVDDIAYEAQKLVDKAARKLQAKNGTN